MSALTATQERILRNLRDGREDVLDGAYGMQQRGGWSQSLYGMISAGLVGVEGSGYVLTEQGRDALRPADARERAYLAAAVERAQERLARSTSTRWDQRALDRAERALAAHDQAVREAECQGFDPGDALAAHGGRKCTRCGVREQYHRRPR